MNKKEGNVNELRVSLLNSFRFFVEFSFLAQTKKKFTVNSHHEILFNKVEDIISGKTKNLILNIAPRYGKTEVMVKLFIAWSLTRNPEARFIHLSYSDSLALDNSSSIKDMINSDWYQYFFPYVQIKKDTKAKEKWYTTEGGGVLARASAGQVTGFGAGQTDYDNELKHFGGAIIIDDPIKPDDVNSDVIRNNVNNKFDTTIRNRTNSRDTPIIIIMQRLHPQDLCGYLIDKEPDKWEVVTMPVVKEDGTALWEAKHTIEELESMREDLGIIFETQYMQNPIPKDGYLLPISELALLPNGYLNTSNNLCFIDPAEKNGDMMSVIFCTIGEYDGKFRVHINDVVHSNKGFEFVSELVHTKAIEHGTNEIIFEKNGVGLGTGIKLKQLNINNDYKLTPYHTTDNKDARILNNYEFVRKYYTFDSEYQKKIFYKHFMNDLTTYTSTGNNTHKKDAMDIVCSSAKILRIRFDKYIKKISTFA